jgi:hypothetical protein
MLQDRPVGANGVRAAGRGSGQIGNEFHTQLRETLKNDKVRRASAKRLLTDVVSLVRFALHKADALVPFGDQVTEATPSAIK